MKKRTETKDIIKKIYSKLSHKPKSILTIAEETNSEWKTTRNNLEILKQLNLTKEIKQGKKRMFFLTKSDNTFFNLPLEKKAIKKINAIYTYIKKQWEKPLPKTTIQKILFDVIENNNLNIPHGWYKYGGICVLKPNEDKNNLSNKLKTSTNKIIKEYSKFEFVYEIKVHQYQKYNKKVYLIKEQILKLFNSNNFTIDKFQKLFIKLSKNYNDEVFSDYLTLLIDMKKNEFTKQEILNSFKAVWDLMAIYNFKKDMEKYYIKEILDGKLNQKIQDVRNKLIQIGIELQSRIPEEEPDTLTYKKLKEALSKIGIADENQIKELEKIRKKKGLQAYNEELFKRAGL